MKASEREPKAEPQRARNAPAASGNGHRSPSRSDQSPPEKTYTAAGELSAESMKATHQFWADGQVVTSSCAFCDWTHEGTALEGREEAKKHREKEHPEACIRKPRMRRRISKQKLRSASEEEQISVDAAEARRIRAERDEAAILAKIERGRLRDAAAEAAQDEAAA